MSSFRFEDQRIQVNFENRHFTYDHFNKLGNAVTVFTMQQTHGTNVCLAETPPCECDGIFSLHANQVLVVKTADCLPILIEGQDYVMALHAGWRGVLNNIVLEGSKKIQQHIGLNTPAKRVWIGPHIQKESFEVDADVANLFLKQWPQYVQKSQTHEQKWLIDLAEIVTSQLRIFNVPSNQIFVSKVNTFSHPDFHSFRRDKSQGGRNLSFIARRS